MHEAPPPPLIILVVVLLLVYSSQLITVSLIELQTRLNGLLIELGTSQVPHLPQLHAASSEHQNTTKLIKGKSSPAWLCFVELKDQPQQTLLQPQLHHHNLPACDLGVETQKPKSSQTLSITTNDSTTTTHPPQTKALLNYTLPSFTLQFHHHWLWYCHSTFEMTSSANPLSPTYFGHIINTLDALILFELCLAGNLNHVARRPHDRERGTLIKSGNVFIYEEHSSGIKRWTDGIPWSPSRILGNFLVYRELERPFPPGEKKRAMKRSRRSPPGIAKQDSYGSAGSSLSTGYSTNLALSALEGPGGSSITKDTERQLIGSLVDSYGFKEEGLVKKTVSVTIGTISHHLVSYYTVADASSNSFISPSKDPRFRDVVPRAELLNKQNFRVSIEEIESMDRFDDQPVPYGTGYPQPQRAAYHQTNQALHRPMSLPTPHNPHMQYSGHNHNGYTNFGIATTPSTAYQPQTQFGTPFTQSHNLTQPQHQPLHGMYPTVKGEPYDVDNSYRSQQRVGSTAELISDIGRGTMAPAAQQFQRRASNYEQHNPTDASSTKSAYNLIDTKLVGLSLSSGYSSPPNYLGAQNAEYSPQTQQNQRFLPPVPTQQTSYDQSPVQNSYGLSNNSEMRDHHPWQAGNASSGHGHFMNSHS